MKLREFLCFHISRMLVTMVVEHYEVSIKRVKKLGAIMDIDVDHEYLCAEIRYSTDVERLWRTGKRDWILDVLAHELTHILTSQITDEMRRSKKLLKREEQVTEHVSRLLLKLYKKEWK